MTLGNHSLQPTEKLVTDMEVIQGTTLTATVGTVATTGIPGVGRTGSVSYAKAGYNPIYANWELIAASNAATFRLTVPAGKTLRKPMIAIRGYTAAAAPANITVNGSSRVADSGFFATVDAVNDVLWITLNQDLAAGQNNISF